MENTNFDTGLREYETMEQLFKRYTNARYRNRFWEEREIYGIISEAAEDGDEEAIYYLAEIYATFPVEYGKKRNRILQYGTTGKSMKALSDAYRYGHYGNVDLKKADEYLEKVGTADRQALYDAILYWEGKGTFNEREKAAKLAADFISVYSDLDIYENPLDALIYSHGRCYQFKNNLVEFNPAEVYAQAQKMYSVLWYKKLSNEDYDKYYDHLNIEITKMAVYAFHAKEQYAQAMEAILLNYRCPVWVVNFMETLRKKAPEGVVEKCYIRAWNQMKDSRYSEKLKQRIGVAMEGVLDWYKKKGTLPYARFVKLAQQEGCPGVEKYVADMEEVLREEAMLSQAIELLETSNYRSALQELERLAGKGNAEANYHLGIQYYQGIKVVQDKEKAKAYMKKAADAGFLEAERLVKEWDI